MKRALLIGCQTGGLTGVDGDVALMDDALTRLSFATTVITGPAATANGIRARYLALIEASGADDAALVYYSGHGGRVPDPASTDPARPEWLQYIVPSDAHGPAGDEPRVILAEELHLLGRALTARTPNATVVLDCCHAARMSRDGAALPKADPSVGVDLAAVAAWRARLRERATSFSGDANPDLVRVVGCSPDQSSYELPSDAFGGRTHGALTAALVPVLTSPAASASTWRDVLDLVRRQVTGLVPGQRPDVEGPDERLLFSVETRSSSGVLAVRVAGGVATLTDAALLGVGIGNTYTLTAPGAAAAPIDTAEVVRLVGGDAVLRTLQVAAADLPQDMVARPLRVALGSRPVLVVPVAGDDRDKLAAAIDTSPYLHVVDVADVGPALPVATVTVCGSEVEVRDEVGLPLYGQPASITAAARIASDLTTLARAAHVRDLTGPPDAAQADDVELVALRLRDDGIEVPLTPGEHLFVGDRVAFRSTNHGYDTRYVSVLDVGVTGRVAVLNTAEPAGTTLAARESYTLGTEAPGNTGFDLFWPDDVPDDSPRRETFLMIVADRKVAGLVRLQQEGVRGRSRGPIAANALEQLIDDMMSGVRDIRPYAPGGPPLRYRVERIDVIFHPIPRPAVDEPPFLVDDRPDPSFRLVLPRGADAPSRVAVRLTELTVLSNRSFLRSRVRVDALVVTAVPADTGAPYATGTARFDRIKDGDRLPFDDLLVYEGPVGRFLDLAVWVSRDDAADRDLSELLAKEVSGTEVAGAITALAGLAVAAPAAALVAGSAAAVAVLVRTAARAIDLTRGTSIGTYRMSLLPHQRFGAAPPPPQRTGRHPETGLIDAQDMRFAYEVIDLDGV